MVQDNQLMNAIVQTIHSESNNNPAPKVINIKKVYEDNQHIDAELENGEIIEYVRVIGNPVKDEIAIVIFADGNPDSPFVIAK